MKESTLKKNAIKCDAMHHVSYILMAIIVNVIQNKPFCVVHLSSVSRALHVHSSSIKCLFLLLLSFKLVLRIFYELNISV